MCATLGVTSSGVRQTPEPLLFTPPKPLSPFSTHNQQKHLKTAEKICCKFVCGAWYAYTLSGLGEVGGESGGVFRTLKPAFTVDCFDDIVLLMPMLAPAAS